MRSEIAEGKEAVAELRSEKILEEGKLSGLREFSEKQTVMLKEVRAELEEKKGLLAKFAVKSGEEPLGTPQGNPGKPKSVAG